MCCTRKWSSFVDNVLVGVRVVFLPNCPLVLSLLKYKDVRAFKKKKKLRIPNKGSNLNSSIDI